MKMLNKMKLVITWTIIIPRVTAILSAITITRWRIVTAITKEHHLSLSQTIVILL